MPCIHTYQHTYTHTHTRTNARSREFVSYLCTYVHRYIHTHRERQTPRAIFRSSVYIRTHTHTHTQTNSTSPAISSGTRKNSRSRNPHQKCRVISIRSIHTYTHTHTYIHTHRQTRQARQFQAAQEKIAGAEAHVKNAESYLGCSSDRYSRYDMGGRKQPQPIWSKRFAYWHSYDILVSPRK